MSILFATAIAAAVLGISTTVRDHKDEKAAKQAFRDQLEKAKAGKTFLSVSGRTVEVATFDSQQGAIEHPQEVTFDPSEYPSGNTNTVLLVNSTRQPIEVFVGNDATEKITDSSLLTVQSEGKKTYVYIRITQN